MNFSRRKFLAAFSASAASALALTSSVAAGLGIDPNRGRLASTLTERAGRTKLNWSSIYPYIGTDFQFSYSSRRGRSEAIALRLLDMSNTDQSARNLEREPQSFILWFAAEAIDGRACLSQDTYSVHHFALGGFELFISEGAFSDGTYIYTAVINRVIA